MAEIIKARMQQKNNTTQDWDKIKGFTPMSGEVIVHNNEDGTPTRVQVGDGTSTIEELNFITGEVYTTPEEPAGAKDGALWIGVKDEGEDGEVEDSQPDWKKEKGVLGHIKNRPFWLEQKKMTITAENAEVVKDETTGDSMVRASSFFPNTIEEIDLTQIRVALRDGTEEYGIDEDRQLHRRADLERDDLTNGLYYLNGSLYGSPSNFHYISLKTDEDWVPLIVFQGYNLIYNLMGVIASGTYFFVNKNREPYVELVEFPYTTVRRVTEYDSFLRKGNEARVFMMNENTIADLIGLTKDAQKEDLIDAFVNLLKEASQYQLNDIILLPRELVDDLLDYADELAGQGLGGEQS